ncbi:WD40 repeat [Methylomagnum ishizawai]|uniref:WD40 repeat n=1 Tax=Methylomagnum ishizawai TaxID=1760988 RepID=A0A1Y6CV75_9GAMM|nr:hypothetical protein [Methylomagnum ishizawai]SMF94110.1 WD40 repeat [Methylomagnum ishizawai]
MNALLSYIEKLLVGIFVLGFLALIAIGVLRYREGESGEGGATWHQAKKHNTIEGYLEFLRDCQSCAHETDAIAALDELQHGLGLVARLAQGHLEERASVALPVFSSDGKTLLALGGKEPHLWDANTGTRLPLEEGSFAIKGGDAITALAYAPDGSWVAAGLSGAENGNMLVWDRQSGGLVGEHLIDGFDAQTLAFEPRAQTLGWLAHGPLGIWEPLTGKFLRATHEGASALAFTRMDKSHTLMVTAAGREIWFWEPATLELVRQAVMKTDRTLLGLSQDGRVAGYAEGPVLELWDVRTGAWIATLQDHDGDALAFCRDIKKGWILVGTRTGSLYLWDTKLPTALGRIAAHEGPVEQLACSGKGRAVSISWDSAKIWDLDKLSKMPVEKPKFEE